MSSGAGGAGLGVVAGWLLGSAPLPTSFGGVAAVLAVLMSSAAAAGALAGSDAALIFLAAVAVGFILRRALQLMSRRGGPL